MAFEKGRFNIVKILLEHNALFELDNMNDQFFLYFAIKFNNIPTADFLIKQGYNLEKTYENRKTL